MTCYHPISAYRLAGGGVVFSEKFAKDCIGDIQLPCGQCIGCRLRRAQDWTLRILHEASCWPSNCFVTLTYSPGNLPPGGSLLHSDYQKFFKRLRFQYRPLSIRYYMCGEYGPLNQRPHYHACLFNLDFPDSKPAGKSDAGSLFYDSPSLTKLWGLGSATVQPLVQSTAAYCARYCVDKMTGDLGQAAYQRVDPGTGEIYSVVPPYSAMSRRPGVGATWLDRYFGDVYRHDRAVHDGRVYAVPKFYDRLVKERDGYLPDHVDSARQLRGREGAADRTPARLAVREQVHHARVRNQKRGL